MNDQEFAALKVRATEWARQASKDAMEWARLQKVQESNVLSYGEGVKRGFQDALNTLRLQKIL